jgi:hypothetical protein
MSRKRSGLICKDRQALSRQPAVAEAGDRVAQADVRQPTAINHADLRLSSQTGPVFRALSQTSFRGCLTVCGYKIRQAFQTDLLSHGAGWKA